jgi:hypothetical protein
VLCDGVLETIGTYLTQWPLHIRSTALLSKQAELISSRRRYSNSVQCFGLLHCMIAHRHVAAMCMYVALSCQSNSLLLAADTTYNQVR